MIECLLGRTHFLLLSNDKLFLRRYQTITSQIYDPDSTAVKIRGGLLDGTFNLEICGYPHWDALMKNRVEAEALTISKYSQIAEESFMRTQTDTKDQQETFTFLISAAHYRIFSDLYSIATNDYPKSVCRSRRPTAAGCWPNTFQQSLLIFDGRANHWRQYLVIIFNHAIFFFNDVSAASPICWLGLHDFKSKRTFINQDFDNVVIQQLLSVLVKQQIRILGSQRLTRQCVKCESLDDYLKICEISEESALLNIIEFQNIRQVVLLAVDQQNSYFDRLVKSQYCRGHPELINLLGAEVSEMTLHSGVSYAEDTRLDLNIIKEPAKLYISAQTVDILINFNETLLLAKDLAKKHKLGRIFRKSIKRLEVGAIEYSHPNDDLLVDVGHFKVLKLIDGNDRNLGFIFSFELKKGGMIDINNSIIEEIGFVEDMLVIGFVDKVDTFSLQLKNLDHFQSVMQTLKK